MKRYIRSNEHNRFNYDVESYEDPADWYIDYDEFYEVIEQAITEVLGLEIAQIKDKSNPWGKSQEYYLSDGTRFSSYDLECDILNDISNDDPSTYDQVEYVANWIQSR